MVSDRVTAADDGAHAAALANLGLATGGCLAVGIRRLPGLAGNDLVSRLLERGIGIA